MLSAALNIPKVFTVTARYMRSTQSIIEETPTHRSEILRSQKRLWAADILDLMGIERHLMGTPPSVHGPGIFVGNHIGFFDIPLVMSYAPVCFVAKRELRKWLVIGKGCELTETILVDRSSGESRRQVIEQIGDALRRDKKQVCIFPSGTTCLDEKRQWQSGAFRIAESQGIPIIPFRIRYSPMRPAAYIDKDNLIVQLWRSQRARPVRAEIEFHAPVQVTDPKGDCEKWRDWAQSFLVDAR